MGGKHARFSPSAAGRRLNCPPSLTLEEQFLDEESEYAAEGSAGHALAEHLIKKHLKQRVIFHCYHEDRKIYSWYICDYICFRC